MSYIEQAIKEAVKGGWVPKNLESWNKRPSDTAEALHFLYPTAEALVQSGRLSEWFLDPAFWQALGKARGLHHDYHMEAGERVYAGHTGKWKAEWHRFIDHLAEGKSAEDFFKELLK